MRWVPSHLDLRGNEEADALALLDRCPHLNNLIPPFKEAPSDRVGFVWFGTKGRDHPDIDLRSSVFQSDTSCDEESEASIGDRFSANVSDRARERGQESCLHMLGGMLNAALT